MYFGDSGHIGLHHMAQEIMHNAFAEAHRGHGSRLAVEILRSGGLRVRDEGRGIPGGPAPLRSGLHSLGLAATTAVSRRLVVEVRRDGFRRRQTFSQGQAISPPEVLGPATKTGTTISLWPDPQIFSCLEFDFSLLRNRLEAFAMLLPRLRVRLLDHRVSPPLVSVIHWPDGLLTGLEVLGRGRHAVHTTPIHGSTRDGDTTVSVAFRWQHDDKPRVWSLCNGTTTPMHGTHVSGLYRGVTQALNRRVPSRQTSPRTLGRTAGEDLRAGIAAIVSVDCPEPQFNNATKERALNVEFEALTAGLTDRLLMAFLAAHPDEARAIADHLEAPPHIDPKTGV
jgi:DNA gyrase subunit B